MAWKLIASLCGSTVRAIEEGSIKSWDQWSLMNSWCIWSPPTAMADEQDKSRKNLDHKSLEQCDVKLNKVVGKGPHEYASEGIGMETNPIDHLGVSSSLNSSGNEQLHKTYSHPVHHQSLHSPQRKHEHGSPSTRDYYHITQMETSAVAEIGVLSGAHPHETHITSSEYGFSMDKNCKTDEARSRKQESSEKMISKEREKQDNLRINLEGNTRTEMENQNWERQKEEEKIMQRQEILLQKESLKNAKKEKKEEPRKEKELVKQIVDAERRTKHKTAKEPIELIEDERLELMELAAQKKGLPAITSLDHDTLQNLELFREFLIEFPPVQLKRPFAIDSDEIIGNLLMVWRFCMTFTDAMSIYPFTLDELVQAFHETDLRLLGEIHISLLKLVIKDMENVSRTSSVSVREKQFTATNPAHSHVVNGAYKWGFDIHDWKNQLGPMSWPKILRQFTLSAGFGPMLREKDVGKISLPDEETKGSENVVASLRNGIAAQKAFEQMRRKVVPSQKKSKHRLTPGTLKYAAYSVLSLEGNKGLTVKKLAHKVQECGLRDLSTSKNPETSITVVLSKDRVHFERIAPSTYRVKTRFRKDPADAESILSAPREKINLNENGFSMERNALDEENEVLKVDDTPDMEKDRGSERGNPEEDCIGITESQLGAPWLQGLTGGEYADLPIQDRLDALVALIDIVNQGTSIRAIVKDRFDNATTLKRNMWAHAQLEQKRVKEQVISKSHHASSMGEEEMKQENLSIIPQDWICHNLNGHTTKEARLCIDHKAEEIYPCKALPLGQDRRLNRYWRFGVSSSGNDPDSGRIFVESPTGQWRVVDSKEEFDALCTSLDERGIRESQLQFMLREIEKSFKDNIKRNND